MKVTIQDLVTLEALRDFFIEHKDVVNHDYNTKLLIEGSEDLVLRMGKYIDEEKKRKKAK